MSGALSLAAALRQSGADACRARADTSPLRPHAPQRVLLSSFSLSLAADPYNTNGGGGFFQGGGGGGSQSSQGGGARKRNDTLRPVTIKQLNEASQPHPDADFLIDDVDVGQVRVHDSSRRREALKAELEGRWSSLQAHPFASRSGHELSLTPALAPHLL